MNHNKEMLYQAKISLMFSPTKVELPWEYKYFPLHVQLSWTSKSTPSSLDVRLRPGAQDVNYRVKKENLFSQVVDHEIIITFKDNPRYTLFNANVKEILYVLPYFLEFGETLSVMNLYQEELTLNIPQSSKGGIVLRFTNKGALAWNNSRGDYLIRIEKAENIDGVIAIFNHLEKRFLTHLDQDTFTLEVIEDLRKRLDYVVFRQPEAVNISYIYEKHSIMSRKLLEMLTELALAEFKSQV